MTFSASEEDFRKRERNKLVREREKICCGGRKIFGASEEKDLVLAKKKIWYERRKRFIWYEHRKIFGTV